MIKKTPRILQLSNYVELRKVLSRQCREEAVLNDEQFVRLMMAPATLARWLVKKTIKPKGKILRIAIIGAGIQDTEARGLGYVHVPFLSGIKADEVHVIFIGPQLPEKFVTGRVFSWGSVQCHAVPALLCHMVDELIKFKVDAAFLFNPGLGSNSTLDLIFGHRNTLLEDGSFLKLCQTGIPIGATSYVREDAITDMRALKQYGLRPTDLERNPWGVTFSKGGKRGFISWSLWTYDIV